MMRDGLGPGTMLGYCTNVHAGASYEQTRANLERYALAVKAQVSPDAPMGVGLWLSAKAARELIEQNRVAELADWLGEKGLVPFTFNGFPHGDFHEPVVKHKVYCPDWRNRARLDYTLDLVTIQDRLLAAERKAASRRCRSAGARLSRTRPPTWRKRPGTCVVSSSTCIGSSKRQGASSTSTWSPSPAATSILQTTWFACFATTSSGRPTRPESAGTCGFATTFAMRR